MNAHTIWKWLDGKKTVFGAILLMIYGAPHLDKWIDVEVLDIIYYIGTALGAGGILHRVSKRRKV
jgi:hypothetical protein